MRSNHPLRVRASRWRLRCICISLIGLTIFAAALHARQCHADENSRKTSFGMTPWFYDEGEGGVLSNIPAQFDGLNINQHVGADRFYDAGITGQDTIVANVEGGHVWSGHESLSHVSQFEHHPGAWGTSNEDLFDRHATWVAGILAGRPGGEEPGDHQLGIAYGADLKSGAIATRWSGSAFTFAFSLNLSTVRHPYETYFGEADVINSSWGGSNRTGTNSFTLLIDAMANENPETVFVAAAGNRKPRSSANTVIYPASGYNGISVGALDNGGDNRYDEIAPFSNHGPQDYGDPVNGTISRARAPVDIAAPGSNLTVAYYGGQTGGNNATLPGSPNGELGGPSSYTEAISGTSFATPIVAGGAALLASASRNTPELMGNTASRDARVVKSVLLNSADKVVNWDNGQTAHSNGNGGVQTTQSLDYFSGAGAVNLGQAYDQFLMAGTRDVDGAGMGNLGGVSSRGWDYGVVSDEMTNLYPIAQELREGTDLTVTLSWFRDRALNSLGTVGLDEAQADLNLYVWDRISGELISESTSIYNVVEHLHFNVPRTSLYTLEVEFAGSVFGQGAFEEYGLAWHGTAVPEPASAWLLIGALLAFACRRGR